MAFTEDLSVYFTLNTPGAVTVSYPGSPAGMVGIRNTPGALELAGAELLGVQQTDRVVLIRTDQVGTLVPGSSITVSGVTTTTRSVLPIEDGQITVVAYK